MPLVFGCRLSSEYECCLESPRQFFGGHEKYSLKHQPGLVLFFCEFIQYFILFLGVPPLLAIILDAWNPPALCTSHHPWLANGVTRPMAGGPAPIYSLAGYLCTTSNSTYCLYAIYLLSAKYIHDFIKTYCTIH